MKINYKHSLSKSIMTNDIPPGTTFYGVIIGESGHPYKGLFLCTKGPTDSFSQRGPLVVSLDNHSIHYRRNLVHWDTCVEVTEYQPVDVEITVKG